MPDDLLVLTPARIGVLVGVVALLLVGAALILTLNDQWPSPGEMSNWIRSMGLWAPMVVIGLMIVHSFVPFPAEVLAVCAGAVFGTLTGAALIWVGAMIGALLAFGLSRAFGRGLIQQYLSGAQGETLDKWTDQQGAFTLLISRFIPVIAFNLINYAAGLTRVPVWTFVWTTGLGIVPITLLSTYLGAQMKDLSWPAILALSAIGIAVVWGVHSLAKKRGWV
ncbi:MAG: putative membrane protein YdjX (TVP38/TMEM64 family) [Paracoccaceae bacterium]